MPSIHDDHSVNIAPDGSRMPQLVAEGDHELRGEHHGGVCVAEGSNFVLRGKLHGSLLVHSGAKCTVSGDHHGSVHIEPAAAVRVSGWVHGSIQVDQGATCVIERSGKHAGSLHNEGEYLLDGVFGGSQSGGGRFEIGPTGMVKAPKIRDGVKYYEW